MSEPLEEQKRARVLELLARADDPSQALEGSELARDPFAIRMLRDLSSLESRLTAAGRAAREEIAAAEDLESALPPDTLATTRAAGGRRRRLLFLVPLTAAAALLLWFTWPRGPVEQPPTYLGDEAVLQPRGASESFVFRWNVERPAGGYFVIRVSELDPGPDGRKLVHESSPIQAQEWTPEPDIASRLPRRIHWELLVYDGSSPRPAATHSADAWLE